MTKTIAILIWRDDNGGFEQTQYDSLQEAYTEMFKQVAEVLDVEIDFTMPENLDPAILEAQSSYTNQEDYEIGDASAWVTGVHHTNHTWDIITVEVTNALPETEIKTL
ncbi:hypothetical protein AGMMS49975_13870 [Clostridia bacterium]|nr:hypothetical protein AGMMS49975_13870 [Clostridia bacterium]